MKLRTVLLSVLAAGRPNPAFGEVAAEYQRYWIEQSRALSGKSTHGSFILAPDSSHFLYLDVPNVVADQVLSIVDDMRKK